MTSKNKNGSGHSSGSSSTNEVVGDGQSVGQTHQRGIGRYSNDEIPVGALPQPDEPVVSQVKPYESLRAEGPPPGFQTQAAVATLGMPQNVYTNPLATHTSLRNTRGLPEAWSSQLASTPFTNVALQSMRQQMDESNHDMVNMLTHQMATVITPLVATTNQNYQLLARQMGRLAEVFGNGSETEGFENQESNRREPQVEIGVNEPGRTRPVVVARNQDPDLVVERVRQMNLGGQNNVANVVEQVLNRHGFNVGYANQPYFVSAFPQDVLRAELPRGIKVPKFSKFSGDIGESTVEHVARYQIECGDLANDELLKMKYFPSSLTKNAFTWFTTLTPNSIQNWIQLERTFHEQFFRGESKVSLIDLMGIKRLPNEAIEDYLNRFRQSKARCFTPVPEHELVQIATGGLEFFIRKKLINLPVRDMAQLADRVRKIEQIKAEKAKYKKVERIGKRDKIAYVEAYNNDSDSNSDFEENEVNVAELKPGPSYVCPSLRPAKEGSTSSSNDKYKKPAYGFDVTKADQIFDILLKDKQIVLSDDHKIPTLEQRKGRKYCKYHNVYGHLTNHCVRFRDLIQKAIAEGRLKFEEKMKGTMKVDTDPFDSKVHYVEPLEINMVEVQPVNARATDMAIDEFEKEVKDIYPSTEETIMEYLSRKQQEDRHVMLCPRCSAVFDADSARTFEEASNKKRQIKQRLGPQKFEEGQKMFRALKGMGRGTSVQENSFVPPQRVLSNQWVRHVPPKPKGQAKWHPVSQQAEKVQTSKGKEVMLQPSKEVRPPKESWYHFSQYSKAKDSMTRTQWRRAQRLYRARMEQMEAQDAKAPQGNKRRYEASSSKTQVDLREQLNAAKVKDMEEDDLLTEEFESGFPDSIQDICGIVSILPAEFAQQVQRLENEEDFEDESLRIPVMLSQEEEAKKEMVSIMKPTPGDMAHMKPLYIKAFVEGDPINRVIVDGGAAINLLPKSTFDKLGKTKKDLLPHNIMITDFAGKASSSEGITALDLMVGKQMRTTIFVVIQTKASFNMLLGREWIHGVGAIPSTVHQKLFLWDQDGNPIVVEADQGVYNLEQGIAEMDFDKNLAHIGPYELDSKSAIHSAKVPYSVRLDPVKGFTLKREVDIDTALEMLGDTWKA